jgi:hypothetical protein
VVSTISFAMMELLRKKEGWEAARRMFGDPGQFANSDFSEEVD